MAHGDPAGRGFFGFGLLALLLVLAPLPLRALAPEKAVTQYHLDTWGVKDGLPAHSITDIDQSRDGYVWLASQGGLVRFDGVRFTVFDSRNVPDLPQPLVWSLSPSRDGGLWAGAYGSGILKYKDGAIEVLPTGKEPAYGYVAVHEGRDGKLWAGYGTWGVLRFAGKRIELERPIRVARAIVDTGDGLVWVGTWGDGLMRLRGGEVEVLGPEQGFRGGSFIAAMSLSRSGTLWIASREGLTAYKEGRYTLYTKKDGLPDNDVKAALEDRDGNVWVGTTQGLVRMRGGVVSPPLRKAQGLLDDQILALHEDDEGGLWVGGRASLARMRDTSITMITAQEGLRVDAITQVLPARGGGLWVATYGGGVALLKDGRTTLYDSRTAGLPNDFVGALHESADGSLWFSVGSNELCRLQAGKVTVFPTGGLYAKSFGEDERGLLMGMSRSGLYRFEGGRVVPYVTADGAEVKDPHIQSLEPARSGGIWLGSNLGLARLRDGRLTRYTEAQGLPKGDAFWVHEDADGVAWVGSAAGLLRLAGDRFTAFQGQPGLEKNAVFTILEDDAGQLWCNSNAGILRVARADLNAFASGRTRQVPVQVFGAQHGLKLAEFRGPAMQRGARTPEGRFFFPSTLGVVAIDPANVRGDPKRPPVIVEEVLVDGRSVRPQPGLVVPAETEKVEIRYTALSYTVPEKAAFKYKLEGFDRDWVDAGPARVAHYTKLPPGRFRFLVRAANADGLWNDAGAVLAFQQQPRFHQTLWFQALAALAAALAVVGGHRLRVYQLRRREGELARKVEEAVAQLKVLRGLLPICAQCKKIRDDKGYFIQIETFLKEHSYAEFSHSICPDCLKELYPDYYLHVPGYKPTS